MYKTICTLLVLLISISFVAAENIRYFEPYDISGKYLNQQIKEDSHPPDRVYELQRGGIYRVDSVIVNSGWTLRIRATDSLGGTKKPIIMLYPRSQSIPGYFVDARGDVELSNLIITGYYELADTNLRTTQAGIIRVSTTPSDWKIIINGCILSNTCGNHIRTEYGVSVIRVTNTIFANMGYLGRSNLGAGKGIDLRDQPIDSLVVQNCTFVNWQDRIIRHYFEPPQTPPYSPTSPIDYLLFDHNTLVNGMSYYGLLALGKTGSKAIITNNLLIDPFSLGNDTAFDRQIEFGSSGEKDPYGHNRMTWIFSEENNATQWTISNNYYAISDSGQAFYDQYESDGVTGEGSPLTSYINSRLGSASANAFNKIIISPKKVPSLMTKLMRWYRSPSGGNKTRNTPEAWVFGDLLIHPYADPYDYDRKGYAWLEDILDCDYYASETPTSTDGQVVGDTRWHLLGIVALMTGGWNLVSVPLVQTNYNADVLFPGHYGVMFKYEEITPGICDYVEAPILELGRGYWVYYMNPIAIHFEGPAPGPITVDCNATCPWKLIGSHETELSIYDLQLSSGYIYGSAFYYDPLRMDYVPTNTISPGQGIWVYLTEECYLTIP